LPFIGIRFWNIFKSPMHEMPSKKIDVVRGLSFIAAAAIVVGNMVGQGVFLKTRVMTCNVETPAMVIAVWLVGGVLTLTGALTLAELAAMIPKSAGIYVFLRDAYGASVGFLYGWMNFVIGCAGVTILGVAFAIFLNIISGGALSSEVAAVEFAAYKVVIKAVQIVAVITIGATMLINCAAVSLGGQVATVLTTFKILLVAAIGAGAFLIADGDWTHFALSGADGICEGVARSARGGFAGFGAAMLGALLAYNGWQSLVMLAGEVKNPQKNIPVALTGGVLLVIALYIFVNLAYFYVLTPAEIASVSQSSSVATETVAKFLGGAASKIMAAALLVSVFGALQINNMMLSRSMFALSRDGLLFDSLGEVSPKTRVPVKAVVVQGLMAMVLVLFGSYDTLTDYYIFALWIFYALAVGAVFVLRRKMPDAERPYRTIGYPFVPILFLTVTVWLLVNTLYTNPTGSIIGLGLIALGLPFYWYRQKRNRFEASVRPE
jgi:basic amino acid/polyamine antiporter, APA family